MKTDPGKSSTIRFGEGSEHWLAIVLLHSHSQFSAAEFSRTGQTLHGKPCLLYCNSTIIRVVGPNSTVQSTTPQRGLLEAPSLTSQSLPAASIKTLPFSQEVSQPVLTLESSICTRRLRPLYITSIIQKPRVVLRLDQFKIPDCHGGFLPFPPQSYIHAREICIQPQKKGTTQNYSWVYSTNLFNKQNQKILEKVGLVPLPSPEKKECRII